LNRPEKRFKGHICGRENGAGDGLGTRLGRDPSTQRRENTTSRFDKVKWLVIIPSILEHSVNCILDHNRG